MRRFSLRIPSALLLAVLAAAPPGTPAQEPAAPTPEAPVARGQIAGKVRAKDGRTPVVGAVVRVSHLRTGQTMLSSPTDGNGAFVLEGIPYGYVDLAVETSEGGYVASQVLNVPPDGHLAIHLALRRNDDLPQGWWTGGQPRVIPGTETPAIGVATVQERGRRFLRSPKGIAIVAGAGALAILALSGGGGGESPASPF